MENLAAENQKPAPKRRAMANENATPLDHAFQDAYDFIHGKKGRNQRMDLEFATNIGPIYADTIYTSVSGGVAKGRGGRATSERTLKVVESRVWPAPLPSGKWQAYFKFYPGKHKKYRWSALSLIELPATISKHRRLYGHMYLAVDYLDVFQGTHTPSSIIGRVNQWSLFVAHAFDRYSERIQRQHETRTEALRLFSEASLTAESKALIEDDKGGAIYVIKTKETCIYCFGYAKIRNHEIYRFFKTILNESMLRNGQRKYLTRLNATSDTWSNEAKGWEGWKKLPIVGAQ